MKIVSPKYIHQIFINEDDTLPKFPLVIRENIRSVKVCYPKARYKLWGITELEAFIEENFDADVLECFKLLKPYAYKADLARYCLVYIYGGLYIDVGLRLLQPVEAPIGFGFLGFRDLLNGTSMWNAVSNGLFWTQNSHRRELMLAIDSIVKNVRAKFYGANPLYPTGPVLLGKSISTIMTDSDCYQQNEFWIGEVKYITGTDSIYFLTPSNQVVAIRMKSISHSDIANTLKANRYNELWENKQVYSEVRNE